MPKDTKKKTFVQFEDDLKALEDISQTISENTLPLDEAMRLFENGMKLSKRCEEALEQAQKSVAQLTEKQDNETS